MPEFSTMLSLQAQMMLLLACGIILTKKGILNEQGRACLTDLLLLFILPANIIQSFRIEFNMDILRSTLDILILSVLLQTLYGLMCAFCYNRYPFRRKAVFQYGTICSNAGFLGSPLAEGLFGSMGLLLTSFYLIPQRIVMWSVGVTYFMNDAAPATPEEKRAHRRAVIQKTLTHPCIVSVFLGILIMLTQWQLPTFLGQAVKCTSNCNMAISMLLIGSIIGSRDIHPLLDRDAILYCIIRLFLMPLVVLVGCRIAHCSQLATGVAVVLAGMPMGGTTAILAEKYGADSTFASKCTAISTVLSLLTTPLWCLMV